MQTFRGEESTLENFKEQSVSPLKASLGISRLEMRSGLVMCYSAGSRI